MDDLDLPDVWNPGDLMLLLAGGALVCFAIWHVTAGTMRGNRRERRDLRRAARRDEPEPKA